MRGSVKKQIIELLDTLSEAASELGQVIRQKSGDTLLQLLTDMQDGVVTVGNQIEASEGQGTKAVELLEACCEALWRLSTEQTEAGALQQAAQVTGLLGKAAEQIRAIREQIVVMFLPYKASMWDCMESVWKAACDDPECIAYVMPIPYFDLKDGQVLDRHYEGDKFPEYVPILNYREVSLEELQPEIAFVHNPFDEYNKVTSVLPQFYSSVLKQFVKKLVYIPYYVTGEAVYVTHRYLPSYENMDFIVTQCEKMMDSYADRIPREKFIPVGSPIADRILYLENHKPEIPEEWKPMLPNGKDFGENRVLMLNTSISQLMHDQGRFLDKIAYIFEAVKAAERITLVWRPHPLLHTSAMALGAEYAARLDALEKQFLEEKIGVLDKTPDVGITVALCDAYLGETASSLIHMFGIAGKPRFYINLWIPRASSDSGEQEYTVSGSCCLDDCEYLLLDEPGWIIQRDMNTGKELPIVRIPGREIVSGKAYSRMEIRDGSIWVYPENAEGIFIYHLEDGRMEKRFRGRTAIESGPIRQEQTPGQDYPAETMRKSMKISRESFGTIRAEWFQRGNWTHEWYESEERTLEDYFYFLQNVDQKELTGYRGNYVNWLASLDGSCGRKILQRVKESLKDS